MDLGLRILATVFAGAILSLLSPPPNWHWLHWVAYLPMFWAVRADAGRANAWLGWLYGVVGVGLLFRWIVGTITIFSPIPVVGAVAILLLFAAVFGAPYALLWWSVHPLRKRLGTGWVLAFPALQVVLEWASMYVLLFPYNHGVSQYRVPYTWQLASITGVYGVTFLVFLVNAALAEAAWRRAEGRPLPVRTLAGVAIAVALVVLYGAWRYERVEQALRDAPKLRVAQLQSDKDMLYRMSHRARDAWDDWLGMTRQIPPGSVDLVVWPEGASPYDLNEEAGRAANQASGVLADTARSGKFDLVVGGGTRMRTPDPDMGEDDVAVFNSVYWFTSDGRVLGHYDKLVPLPFGEYVPFGWLLPEWVGRSLNIGDFRAGEVPVVFEGGKVRAATPICYEAVLPGTCRLFASAELFVTVTNDAWFGDTANPWQHQMLAATRSVELGIPMVRSAYTGVSAVIEPHGFIHSETRPFQRVSRIVEVRLRTFPTFYKRFGDWFVGLCALGLAGALVATRSR